MPNTLFYYIDAEVIAFILFLGLFAGVTLIVMITLIVWVLIDLDRPARGLILISQQSMSDLQQSLQLDVP